MNWQATSALSKHKINVIGSRRLTTLALEYEYLHDLFDFFGHVDGWLNLVMERRNEQDEKTDVFQERRVLAIRMDTNVISLYLPVLTGQKQCSFRMIPNGQQ